MSDDEFFEGFARSRNDFLYVDDRDESKVVIDVGITAAFHVMGAYTSAGRQRIADAVQIYCRYHGEKLKWGYTGADDLQEHDYSPASAMATLAYLRKDGFAEPLAFRWACETGYGQVASYMIDGYSPAGWVEDIHGTFTTIRFYLPIDEILEGRKSRFESLLKEMLEVLAPSHAAAGLGIQHTYQWEDFQHIEYQIAMAYQGLDVVRPRGNPSWRSGYSNLNWYTYINSQWMGTLGTQDTLLATLDDVRVDIQSLADGMLFRAGDWPVLWKVGVDQRPALYVRVNEAIKTLRVTDAGAFHYGSIAGEPRMNPLVSNAWIRRFDLPAGMELPRTPVPYRRISKAELERAASNKKILDDFVASTPRHD
ncbi:DUF3396 domain-containing protein [Pseudomonas sp. GD03858]|uniref:type VI immunity family protein n=1 Tax=unclassified Pseudomonas TaxID=196821 RepID=UPI002448265F|nr:MULTISPECIES: type VI immunity family protein [unclassified Pseudomonas]MDH0648437.1 DUF3396 domain-containing protein [Pseudomonas sp. GD03867]MDH0664075.1 DUF3396 domain-containing protein [Pseudomonas sp. GD03858]